MQVADWLEYLRQHQSRNNTGGEGCHCCFGASPDPRPLGRDAPKPLSIVDRKLHGPPDHSTCTPRALDQYIRDQVATVKMNAPSSESQQILQRLQVPSSLQQAQHQHYPNNDLD